MKTPFELGLLNQIHKYIRMAREDGTVGMSVENLRQCVRPPASGLQGAPNGTNAQYFYAELFRKVCSEDKKISSFIIK